QWIYSYFLTVIQIVAAKDAVDAFHSHEFFSSLCRFSISQRWDGYKKGGVAVIRPVAGARCDTPLLRACGTLMGSLFGETTPPRPHPHTHGVRGSNPRRQTVQARRSPLCLPCGSSTDLCPQPTRRCPSGPIPPY